MKSTVLISLGSNEGDRQENIQMAIAKIQEELGNIIAIAPIYETPSWGYNDTAYLNNAICLTTDLQALDLMLSLLDIERQLGRERSNSEGYEARSIDLDIILIEGVIVDHPQLQVPHPRMNLRKFVLQPLVDIAPNWIHETVGLSMGDLLDKCEDESQIKYYGQVSLYSN
jgi:2-amino-4-hydroxy-6-hydroxymethyldihydropteridine diphosphokinase